MANAVMGSKNKMWGQHLVLDLSGCPKEKISDGENILAWGRELVKAIDMVAYGKPQLEHFATHKTETAGYTFVQLIETSNICAHFAENLGEVYIDIFSCRDFDEQKALEVTKQFFQPEIARIKNFNRGETFQENLYGSRNYQGFAVDDVLFEGQSDYQKVSILQNKELGRVLTLDNIIQTTQNDEFTYHEMIAHVPIMSLPHAPEHVLIVGGGDGGCLREALKYPTLKRADMVEIDQMVVDQCVKHMPTLNNAGAIYKDSRANLLIQDAFKFMKDTTEKYDAIIVDSTDPFGAAEALFGLEFYQMCQRALKPGGTISTQNGVPFFQAAELAQTSAFWRQLGLLGQCYLATVPTYYGGSMALGFGVNAKEFKLPTLEQLEARMQEYKLDMRHYTPQLHLAAFALPKWVQEIMAGNANAIRKAA